MSATSQDDALRIAKGYLDAAHALGDYRFTNFKSLSLPTLQKLESDEWDLLNYSSSFVTKAVGIMLQDLQADLQLIVEATAQARKVVQTITTVKDVLTVTATLIELGGAIIAKDPVTILKKAGAVVKTAKDVLAKPDRTDVTKSKS